MLKLFTIVGFYLLFASLNIYIYAQVNIVEGMRNCAAENNVSKEDLDAFQDPDGFNTTYFNDKYNVKCYEYCFMRLGEFVDENGQFLYEEVRHRFDDWPEHTKNTNQYLSDACQNSTVGYEDPCEASYQLAVCWQFSFAELFNLTTDNLV